MTEPAPVTPIGALQDAEPAKAPRSQWKDVWDQFRRHKVRLAGTVGF